MVRRRLTEAKIAASVGISQLYMKSYSLSKRGRQSGGTPEYVDWNKAKQIHYYHHYYNFIIIILIDLLSLFLGFIIIIVLQLFYNIFLF